MASNDGPLSAKRLAVKRAFLRHRSGRSGLADSGIERHGGLSKGKAARASMAQERLATVQALAPRSPFYHCFRTWRIRGALDFVNLREAVAELGHRHDLLCSRLCWKAGILELRRGDSVTVPTRFVDLTGLTESDREPAARREVERGIREPFDIDVGPLMRMLVCRLDDNDHILLINGHHIACDGWSFGLIHRELAEFYESLCLGKAITAPTPPIQYADYAMWQRSRWRQRMESSFADYWRTRLAGSLPTLDLPTDFPRPSRPRFQGDRVTLLVSPPLCRALDRLALREQATRFVVLMAAFQCLLHRYSAQEDLLVGTPVANRDRGELQGLVGLIVNTLVVRTSFEGDPRFIDYLRQVRDHWVEDLSRADTPFEWLVETFDADRHSDRNPLFQTLFVLHNTPDLDFSLRGLQVEPYVFSSAATPGEGYGTSKFDLTMSLCLRADRLEGSLEYDVDLFRRSTIESMAEQFLTLLESATGHPDVRVSELSMMTEDRRRFVLAMSRGNAGEYPRDSAIHRVFESIAAECPRAVALACGSSTLSYGELNADANRVARWLCRINAGRGTGVGVLMDRSELAVLGILGILKAGAVYIPLNPDDPPARLHQIVREAGVECLLATSTSIPSDPVVGVPIHPMDAPDADWRSEGTGNLDLPVTGEDPAYIMFTSGSTGTPKGVVVPHRAVLRLVLGADYIKFGPAETFLLLAPLSFDASTFELWGALLHGGQCAIFPDRVPSVERLESVLMRHQVTILWLTSALFNLVVDTNPAVLRNVRQLLSGGEALSVEHVRRALACLPETKLCNGYGPTESTTFATVFHIPRSFPRDVHNVPIGRPIANTTVYILDAGSQFAAIGVPGEIHIGGDGLALGYLDDPTATDRKFVTVPGSDGGPMRLYRTGDWARRRPDGEIEFLGRRDNQIKIRGFRVEPGEIESAFRRLPNIADCAVVVDAGPTRESRLVAFYVPVDPEAVGEAGALRTLLAPQLPSYMVPSVFISRRALPTTANGKVDRGALRAAIPEVSLNTDVGVPEPGSLEESLSMVWCEVLGLESVGIHSDFLDLGGNSLAAMKLKSRIVEQYGVSLELGAFLSRPTIAEFAEYLRSDEIDVAFDADTSTGNNVAIPEGGEHGDTRASRKGDRQELGYD